MVVLPPPDRPTSPSFVPAGTAREKRSNSSGCAGECLKLMSRTSTLWSRGANGLGEPTS